jgi:hypothetical protein
MDEMGRRELTEHIQSHVQYPATRTELVEACSHMAHVPESTRKWAEDNLPDGTYASAEDVLHALKLPHEH